MFSIGTAIDRASGLEVKNVPVGNGILFSGFSALSTLLIKVADGMNLAPYFSGPIGAALVKNIKPVTKFLGPTGSDIFAIALMSEATDQTLDVEENVRKGLAWVYESLNQPVPAALQPLSGAPAYRPQLSAPVAREIPSNLSVGQLSRPLEGPGTALLDRKLNSINMPTE